MEQWQVPNEALPELEGYEVLRKLSEGGQARVYQARDTAGTLVAIKRWRTDSPRAQREFEVLEALRGDPHPNVVRIVGFTRDPGSGQPCLVMRHIDAPPLSDLLAAGPLEARRAARMVMKLARALEHVHRHVLAHRDVKPENILVDAGDEPVILDFGTVMQDEASALTETGRGPPGSYAYMSPEQLRYPKDVDRRTDVYALGVTLYASLTAGRLPKHRDLWRDLTVEVPEALKRVISKCLEDKPEDRYQRAADLARDLERYLVGGGSVRVLQPLALAASVVAIGVGAFLLWGDPPEAARTAAKQPSPAPVSGEQTRPQPPPQAVAPAKSATGPAKTTSQPPPSPRKTEQPAPPPPVNTPRADGEVTSELGPRRTEDGAQARPPTPRRARPLLEPPTPRKEPRPTQPTPKQEPPPTRPTPKPKAPAGARDHDLQRFRVSEDGRYLVGVSPTAYLVFYRPPKQDWVLTRRLPRFDGIRAEEVDIFQGWVGIQEGDRVRLWNLRGDPARAKTVPLTGDLRTTLTSRSQRHARFCRTCGARIRPEVEHRHGRGDP